jgi:hypothetical protein
MPERDGYIPGVPCWVDASEPDPEAAVDFYAGLFGWEFEQVMPPRSEGKYFIAWCQAPGSSIFDTSGDRHGGDVAAVRSIPRQRRRRRCGTPTSGSIAPTRPRLGSAMPAEASWWSPTTS